MESLPLSGWQVAHVSKARHGVSPHGLQNLIIDEAKLAFSNLPVQLSKNFVQWSDSIFRRHSPCHARRGCWTDANGIDQLPVLLVDGRGPFK